MGQAAAAGLTGLFLTLIGYEKLPGEALPEGVKKGIFDISTLVPAVGFILLAVVLWFWYPLHKAEVEKNVAYLKKKHNAE
jgi:GPH family glycoside/pentoside/hexuronide:cation symporter